MSALSTDDNATGLSNAMVAELARALRGRYHTAMLEGKSEQQAFEEIVTVILSTYREVLAS